MTFGDNARGAGRMAAAMAAFTLSDTCMKTLAEELPLYEVLALRGCLTLAILAPFVIAARPLRQPIARTDWRLIAMRSVGEVGAALFFVAALFHLPLANVSAVLQALPLTVTLGAAVFLGERVGWRRIAAIMVGFLGVIVVVRPGPEGFDGWTLFAIASVACVTLRDLATRRLSRGVPSLVVATAAAVSVTVVAGVLTIGDTWVMPSRAGALALTGAAAAIVAGYVLSVAAMRTGEIGAVAPFRYTGLLWALGLGYAVFGDWPDATTLAGAALIVGMGIYTFWREHRAAASPVPVGLRLR